MAENVVGLVSASGGDHYRSLHRALADRGYQVGAVVLNAVHWVPQSRPRIFVVAVREGIEIADLRSDTPIWCEPAPVVRAAQGLEDFVWWRIPKPSAQQVRLDHCIDFETPCDSPDIAAHNLSLIPERHRDRMASPELQDTRVFPGYKRTRNGQQVLELRFDGVAGCLRTPEGGSSRQHLVLPTNGTLKTRLLTVREAARLMGAPPDYQIPGTYNDGYRALGDAVAVPPVRHLVEHLLAPLAERTALG